MITEKERAKIESQAKKLLKRNRYEDAIAEYKKLLVGDDKDVLTRNIIGDLYVKIKQHGKASEQFRSAAEFYERKGLESKSIALYKKITKISPDDLVSIGKLADLFKDKGFLSEAKKEYIRLADSLKKKGKIKRAVAAYEKLLTLDRNNSDFQVELAALYEKDGQMNAAVRMLNDAAEEKLKSDTPEEAKPLLKKARNIAGEDVRTLSNIVNLLVIETRFDQAVKMIQELMEKHDETPELLSLLGRIYFDSKKWDEADAIFLKVLEQNPKEADVRLKSGKIRLMKKNYDGAFTTLEPLIDSYIIRQKVDKVIGLLGMIILNNPTHLPALKKLFDIIEKKGSPPELETVARLLQREYDEQGMEKEVIPVLGALLSLYPEDEKMAARHESLMKKYPPKEPGKDALPQADSGMSAESMEILQASLGQVELYVAEKRYREAKKFFGQLMINYPGNPLIVSKSQELAKAFALADEDIGPDGHVDQTESPGRSEEGILGEVVTGPKKSAADIFAGTDIAPLIQEKGRRIFYDLSQVIKDELAVLDRIYREQKKTDGTAHERELDEIVSRFRRGVSDSLGKEKSESHYNLGIAYIEQGLVDEALEEFKLAAADDNLKVAAYSFISLSFSKKRDYTEAMDWVEKALALAEPGTGQFFALIYDKAQIFFNGKERDKALELFQMVHSWDPDFRDVSHFIDTIEKPRSRSKKPQ